MVPGCRGDLYPSPLFAVTGRVPVRDQPEQHAIGNVFSALSRRDDLLEVPASLFPTTLVENQVVLANRMSEDTSARTPGTGARTLPAWPLTHPTSDARYSNKQLALFNQSGEL
jgi:hypothetical protein